MNLIAPKAPSMSARLSLAIVLAAAWSSGAGADPGGLAVKTGFWKKTIAMESSGADAIAPMTMDVCMTADALSFENFSRSPGDESCTWSKKSLASTRIDVAVTCASMTAESTTEVIDEEHVRVTGTATTTTGGRSQ
jgi:hypothetical protein